MNRNESFVLIKPDGIKNKEIKMYLLEKLKRSNIQVIVKNKKILNANDVLILWPAYLDCYISKKLLIDYMSNQEIEIWKVLGNNISEELNIIKKEIRKKYGKGCIANCIHTPFDYEEAKWQYDYLNNKMIDFDAIKHKVEYHTGLFGKLLNIDKYFLDHIIEEVMKERESCNKIQKVLNEVNEHQDNNIIITLLDQNRVSMDYVASVLMETFEKYYTLNEILNIVLDVDLYGKRKLIITDLNKAKYFSNILKKQYQLDVKFEKIVDCCL